MDRAAPADIKAFRIPVLLAGLPALGLTPAWGRIFAGRPGAVILAAVLVWAWAAVIFAGASALWRGRACGRSVPAVFIAALAAALSGFWLMVFYPAVMSWDAMSHWQHAISNQYNNWTPPLFPMLMHFLRIFVKGPGFFAFVQGWLFWGALFYLAMQMARSRKAFLVQAALLALLPPLWLYSNAANAVTWGASFLLLALGLLIRAVKDGRYLPLLLSVLSLSGAVMFRREMILCAAVPMTAYLFYFPRKTGLANKALGLVIMGLITLAPARLIELAPSVTQVKRAQIHGVFTQYVGTVVHSMGRMSPSEIEKERRSIDGEFGDGVFDRLIARYDCSSGDYIIYSRKYPSVMGSIPKEKTRFILDKVVRTAAKHPLGYFRHQICYMGYLAQFTGISYQSWGVLKEDPLYQTARARHGIPYRSLLPSVKAGYVRLMNYLLGHPVFSLIFRHGIFLLVSAVLLILGFARRRTEWIFPSLAGLIIFLAYLAAGPAGLWRYLLPSYLAAWVCLPEAVGGLFSRARRRGGGRNLGPAFPDQR